MKKIHFISGLPRSGGSLLGQLLAQDKDVTVAKNNTACHEILYAIRNNWSNWKEHQHDKSLQDESKLRNIYRGIMNNYCDSKTDAYFDKGRSWLSLLEMAEFALDREVKVIVPVRSIKAIAASCERRHRSNAHNDKPLMINSEANSVESRTNALIADDGIIGVQYNRIKDAIQRGFGNRMFLVDYDDLLADPSKCMNQIWDWLDFNPPSHDFSIIEKRHSDDYAYRILGDDVCSNLDNTEFWRSQPSQKQTN